MLKKLLFIFAASCLIYSCKDKADRAEEERIERVKETHRKVDNMNNELPDLTEEDLKNAIKLKEKEMLLKEIYGEENI